MKKQSKTSSERYYYPDYITEALFRLGQASGSEGYPLLNKRIDIIHILYNQFENFPITDQVYSYVWGLLNNMTSNGYTIWVKEYWGYACQYYMLSMQYNQSKQSEEGKNRFLEFHLMVGVLMIYMKRYDLLYHFLTYTSSLPAKYPLVPSTFHYIYRCYRELSKKNERMYLLKYHMKGMEEGAREDTKIESLLLDYIALLLIRLNTVNDYNITYSDPLNPPLAGDTLEEAARNMSISDVLLNRIDKWGKDKDALDVFGFCKDDVSKAQCLLSDYKKTCEQRQKEIDNTSVISDIKKAALKNSMLNALSEIDNELPFYLSGYDNGKEVVEGCANQSTEIDKRMILAGRESISNNLGDAIVIALFTEIRLNYCYQFVLHNTAASFAIPYMDMSKALDRLGLDNNYTILAMGVLPHFFEEVEGFLRNSATMELRYKNVNVVEIASNENSFIIMKSIDIPRVVFRKLDIKENTDGLEEIDSTYHLFSNINSIKDDLILKARMGYQIHITNPMKYVRLRIAYQLDSDSVLLNRVQPIKNYIV